MKDSNLSILLAGEEARRRSAVRCLIESMGALCGHCSEVASWPEAREALRRDAFDLYLVDAALDAAQGRHLLAEARACRGPVVVLLEGAAAGAVPRLLAEGAAECLCWEALERASLEQAVRHALARREAACEQRSTAVRYRALIENTQDIITVLDQTATILYESPSIERVLGYVPTEMLGRNAFEFIHPEDAPDVIAVFAYGIERRGYTASVEYRFRHKDGSWRTLESRAKNLLDDPIIAGVVVNSRDITERKRVEEALRRSEARNGALLEALPDAMFRVSREGVLLDVELPRDYKAVEDRGRLLGRSVHEVLPPAAARSTMRAVAGALDTGEMQSYEYEVEVGGEVRVREARVVVSGTDEVISIQRDITERKRAEEALRKSEALLRTVTSNVPVVLFALDRDGVFTLSEGKGLESLGARPGQAVGRSAFELYADRPDILVDLRRVLDGETFSSSLLFGEHAFECYYTPILASGGSVAGAIGVAADVTALRRQEEQLKASQEQLRLLARNQQAVREAERTRIAREVHDVLGQSLTALRLDVSHLEKELAGAPDGLRDRLALMKHMIDQTIRIVRRIATELRPGVLDDLGVEAALEWQVQEFELRTGLPCSFTSRIGYLNLDRDRSTAIFRIFQEILTNIIRHAEAHQVDIVLSEAPGAVVLEVTDDGRGVQAEDLRGGTSLGLLGMQERAQAFGGSVEVRGLPGRGTKVTVTLPTEPADPAGAS